MTVDTSAQVVVHSTQGIAPQAEAWHLSRGEALVVRMMRELAKHGKSWQLFVSGNSAGVRVQELLPPKWEPK